jgi:xylulokinase
MGERAPVWNPDARGVFFGLERYHGRGDLVEAVFESAGFTVRHLMEAIEAAGVAVGRIRVSGGLTRVAHISQLKADITGREVLVVDEFETTSLGAMLFASVGIGRFPNMAEAAKVVRVRMVIHPDPERHKVFSDIFGLYCELYETLIPLFSRRMNLLAGLHERVEAKVTNL